MNKILIISIAVLTMSTLTLAQDQPQKPAVEPTPLIEGCKFDRIDGLVTKDQKQDKWFFTPENNLTDGRGLIPAGQKIQLLPSSTLEAITAVAEGSTLNARISASVTKYRNQNFLFPTYFIPMNQAEQTPPPLKKTEETKDKADSQQNSIIPLDVMKKLKPRNRPDPVKRKQIIQTDADSILPSRTGFIAIEKQNKTFTIDALGRNVENINLQLLPCQTLERLENKIAQSPYRQRYRIAGITTKYKNNYYLLPQQAARTYNHGNFAR